MSSQESKSRLERAKMVAKALAYAIPLREKAIQHIGYYGMPFYVYPFYKIVQIVRDITLLLAFYFSVPSLGLIGKVAFFMVVVKMLKYPLTIMDEMKIIRASHAEKE